MSGERVVIAGGPKTGKTTLAAAPDARHTDDLIGTLDWSAASAEVARWFSEPGPWTIEGVACIRALRKALDTSPAKPCDRVILLTRPHVMRTTGQEAMWKADAARWREIEPELRRRGVIIDVR